MTNKRIDTSTPPPVLQVLLGVFVVVIALALAWSVRTLPPEAIGLHHQVQANLAASGASNPVTAVIINFRGYDTLLEMGVLLLAVLGVWALGPAVSDAPPSKAVGRPVLTAMVRLLTPLMILVAVYILWAGGHAPGGAFQGGAILGAAGVLVLLSDVFPLTLRPAWRLRAVLLLGFTVFLLVATGTMLAGHHLLEYPRTWASGLILLIETASTLSIGCMLVLLFAGRPSAKSSSTQASESREHLS